MQFQTDPQTIVYIQIQTVFSERLATALNFIDKELRSVQKDLKTSGLAW